MVCASDTREDFDLYRDVLAAGVFDCLIDPWLLMGQPMLAMAIDRDIDEAIVWQTAGRRRTKRTITTADSNIIVETKE